jgi:hypothetical protein
MADIYCFIFDKSEWTREKADALFLEQKTEHKGIIENENLLVYTVKDKPEHEETTRIIPITRTSFVIVQDLPDSTDDEKTSPEEIKGE